MRSRTGSFRLCRLMWGRGFAPPWDLVWLRAQKIGQEQVLPSVNANCVTNDVASHLGGLPNREALFKIGRINFVSFAFGERSIRHCKGFVFAAGQVKQLRLG